MFISFITKLYVSEGNRILSILAMFEEFTQNLPQLFTVNFRHAKWSCVKVCDCISHIVCHVFEILWSLNLFLAVIEIAKIFFFVKDTSQNSLTC